MKNKTELQQDLLDLSADGADVIIDLLEESELLKDLPGFGFLYKFGKAVSSIPDRIFLQKVGKFIKSVNEKTTEKDRIDFTELLKQDKDKREKLYSAILLKIDKFDDISKPDLFAKIFSCFITNKIREEDYNALSSALNFATLEELYRFCNSYWEDRNHFERNVYELPEENYGNLLSTSLVKIDLKRDDKRLGENSSFVTFYNINFQITELGCLYVYIAEDFEKYFNFMNEIERSYLKNEDKIYSFETPFSNEELGENVRKKWTSKRISNT